MNIIYLKNNLPDWSSLPVLVVKNFLPGSQLSCPLVQLRVCYVAKLGLYFLISSYENANYYKSLPNHTQNCMRLVVCLDPEEGHLHEVVLDMQSAKSANKAETEMVFGEDLQGKFWGAQVFFALSNTKQPLEAGDILAFNLFKSWQTNDKFNHFGRLFGPATLKESKPLQGALSTIVEG